MASKVVERRVKRSAHADTAIQHQMSSSQQQAGFEAMVLADESGLVLVGIGETAVCEELAAIAPLTYRTVLGMPLPSTLAGGKLVVRTTQAYGQTVFLAVLGGNCHKERCLTESAHAVKRIFNIN